MVRGWRSREGLRRTEPVEAKNVEEDGESGWRLHLGLADEDWDGGSNFW